MPAAPRRKASAPKQPRGGKRKLTEKQLLAGFGGEQAQQNARERDMRRRRGR